MTWGRHVHTRKVANELVPSVASKNSAPFAPESTLIWSSPPQRNVRLAPASETNSPPYGQLYKTLNPVRRRRNAETYRAQFSWAGYVTIALARKRSSTPFINGPRLRPIVGGLACSHAACASPTRFDTIVDCLQEGAPDINWFQLIRTNSRGRSACRGLLRHATPAKPELSSTPADFRSIFRAPRPALKLRFEQVVYERLFTVCDALEFRRGGQRYSPLFRKKADGDTQTW